MAMPEAPTYPRDIGRYQLVEAEVPDIYALANIYRALDRSSGEEVEIHHYSLLPLPTQEEIQASRRQGTASGDDLEVPERFHRQAAEASRLSHPGIARVLGYGDWDGYFPYGQETRSA
jgi:hypothetical protein